MPARAYSFVRWTLVVVACFLLIGACGRSNIDDYSSVDDGGGVDGGFDARVDGPSPSDAKPDSEGGITCGPTSCPSGCCDINGRCQTGTSPIACGTVGERCINCKADGFQLCDATSHACANTNMKCTPQNCGGCCDNNLCFGGSDPNECGKFGGSCQHCAQQGLACGGQQCVSSSCGPQNCQGCCFGDQCLLGQDQTACGDFGQQCQNCAAQKEACVPQGVGGACQQPTCNQANCPGCCFGNQCVQGTDPKECGAFGQQCQDCVVQGESCTPQPGGGSCQFQQCGPQNCMGCCAGNAGNQCVTGVDQAACGELGQQCQNCTSLMEQCQQQGPGFGGACVAQQLCGPQNCPGCCLGNMCVPGFDPNACGDFGQQCQNCAFPGGACVKDDAGTGGTCANQQQCGPQNCAGCCVGNQCVAGVDPFQCGSFGQQCQNCSQPNETCAPQGPGGGGACVITPPTCNPQSCPTGCCQGNLCFGGLVPTQCGIGGVACQDCTLSQETCDSNVQQCVPVTPVCNPSTCPSGCCAGDICAVGTQVNDCGKGGLQCQNCGTQNATCQAQVCVPNQPKCTPLTCTGCCDANDTCQFGSLPNQCGQKGIVCVDCTQQGTSCDPTTRTCQAAPLCPEPYGSCAANVQTPIVPIQRGACGMGDLANAAVECSGGANTPTCQAFFAFEAGRMPAACASCLAPFDYDFQVAQGLFHCVAPFVGPSCDHNTGCVDDCLNQSCALCAPTAKEQCEQSALGGQCQTYLQQAQCVFAGFMGQGQFCDPNQYGGNYGQWLQAVGQHYCGP